MYRLTQFSNVAKLLVLSMTASFNVVEAQTPSSKKVEAEQVSGSKLTAFAGEDQRIYGPPFTAVLDGDHEGGTGNISYRWRQLFVRDEVTIESAEERSTLVTDLDIGIYTFELSVTDETGDIRRDSLVVSVYPRAREQDAPPKKKPEIEQTPEKYVPPDKKKFPADAYAGQDQTIYTSKSQNTVTLHGSREGGTGKIAYHWRQIFDRNDGLIASANERSTVVSNLDIGTYYFELSVRDEVGSTGRDSLVVRVLPQPPIAVINVMEVITLPVDSTYLYGGNSIRGYYPVVFLWSVHKGPGTPTLSDSSAEQTTLRNLQAGLYEVMLTLTNTQGQTSSAFAMVTVKNIKRRRKNTPPTISTASIHTIVLPFDSIKLAAEVHDPDGDSIYVKWHAIEPPDISFRIVSPLETETIVKNLALGKYHFEIFAGDYRGGEKTAGTTVVVLAPPTANAGLARSVLKGEDAKLNGEGHDVDGFIVGYRWTKISGPDHYEMDSASYSHAQLKHLEVGEYEFQLRVTDNDGLHSIDTVQIQVLPPKFLYYWWTDCLYQWIIPISIIAALAILGYQFWWPRRRKKVIVYFMTDEERTVARKFLANSNETEAFIVGYTSESKILRMKEKGIVFRLLNTTELTVCSPGVTKTYKFSTRGRSPKLLLERREHPGENFVNVINGKVPSEITPGGPEFYIITLDGPLLNTYSERLKEIGLSIIKRIPDDSYLVEITTSEQFLQLRDSKLFRFIRVIVPYTAEDTGFTILKSHYSNGELSINVNPLTIDITLHNKRDLQSVYDLLRKVGVERVNTYDNTIRVQIFNKPVYDIAVELASNKYIQAIYEHIPSKWHNNIARTMIGLDNSGSSHAVLSETGMDETIAVADSGIDESHEDFIGRIKGVVGWCEGVDTGDALGHGTHVAGTIVGTGSMSSGEIKGVAPGARLFVQSLLAHDNGMCNLQLKMPTLLKEAYDSQARIINISWGAATEGYYTFDSAIVDQFVYNNPEMLVVVSAGNDGRTTIDDNGKTVAVPSVGSPAANINGLTVGACHSTRNGGDAESVTKFSSNGPCRDNRRIKPDLVAPGTQILSTRSMNAPDREFEKFHDKPKYVYLSGTSMATPIVSGSAALVREYYKNRGHATPSAALIKATLINGTRRLNGESSMRGRRFVPNNCQGFGMVHLRDTIPNLQASFNLHFRDSYTEPSLSLKRTSQERKFSLVLATSGWIRISMVFIDNPGGRQSDLNLILKQDATGLKWTGNQGIYSNDNSLSGIEKDFENNIETIREEKLDAGAYTIAIKADNIPIVTEKGLVFALVVTTEDSSSQLTPLQR